MVSHAECLLLAASGHSLRVEWAAVAPVSSRELCPVARLQKIRHRTSIAQRIPLAAPLAKSVPTLSTGVKS